MKAVLIIALSAVLGLSVAAYGQVSGGSPPKEIEGGGELPQVDIDADYRIYGVRLHLNGQIYSGSDQIAEGAVDTFDFADLYGIF